MRTSVVPISTKENKVTHNTNKRFGFLNRNSHGGMTLSQCQQLKGNIKSMSPRYLYQPMHIRQMVNIYHMSVRLPCTVSLYPSIHLLIHPSSQTSIMKQMAFQEPLSELMASLCPGHTITAPSFHQHPHSHTNTHTHAVRGTSTTWPGLLLSTILSNRPLSTFLEKTGHQFLIHNEIMHVLLKWL